ncbi:MAG: rod shape-determining protein MreC [Patescibacteria group bacterium]
MDIRRLSKLFFVFLIIALAIIILHYTRVLAPIENGLHAALKPVMAAVYNLSTKINLFFVNQKSTTDLVDENARLRAELLKMQVLASENEELTVQNEFMRRQLDYFSEAGLKAVVADVIGRSQDSYQNFLIINQGEKQGLKPGAAVTDQNVLVGKIYSVDKYTAKVLLINDSFSKLAVSVQNSDQTIGVLSGEFGLGLKIELIPQNEDVIPGDLVITSGLEQDIPRGLLVGQVDNVIYTEGELFKTAFVKSPMDFNKINFVSVLESAYGTEDN